ncbi:MAG TPA: hypothetical protein VKK79_15025 [Candidatus Lokiarchaeia archaeon]|nr:hypothetical protein [Candidatus Lokiarchaeia archaeon]
MKDLYVYCPICHARGSVSVPKYIFENTKNGIANVQVAQGDVCEHQMLVSVDRNFKIRGTEPIDFQVIIAPQEKDAGELSLGDVVSKINTYAASMLLQSFIFNFKTYVIASAADAPTFGEDLNNFFNSILPSVWKVPPLVKQVPRRDFKKLIFDPQEYLLIDSKGIVLNQPWGKRQLFLGEDLIKLAATQPNAKSQNAAMQQKVQNLFDRAAIIENFLQNKEFAYEEDLKLMLENEIKRKIKSKHLETICFLIERRYDKGLQIVEKIRSKSFDMLSGALWS